MDTQNPDTNDASTHTPPPSSADPGAPAPSPRRGLTYATLLGATLTLLAVLGAQRQHHVAAGPTQRPADPALPAPRLAEPPSPILEGPAARPQVELVFALDTTSSMTNLIEGAKQKIWSLASFVAQGQPTPDLRVGLVGYRDIGDAYVTKVFDLDSDLDRVYRRLRAFQAEGGGDTPEHVARALDESVRKMSWSQSRAVVKVIYLVGDAPPHTDYDDGYDYVRAARAAKAKGIQLHAIQCGEDGETEAAWRRIASLGGGQYMTIRQDGGMHEEHTRYDDEMASLHDKLTGTAIPYGAGRVAAMAASSVAEAAPPLVKAERAAYMARKGKAVGGDGDLVDSIASGKVKLKDVQAELPAAMRGMDEAKQASVIAAKQKDREAISRRIEELARLRNTELDTKAAAAKKAGVADGFDAVAKKALKKSVSDNALSGLAL